MASKVFKWTDRQTAVDMAARYVMKDGDDIEKACTIAINANSVGGTGWITEQTWNRFLKDVRQAIQWLKE